MCNFTAITDLQQDDIHRILDRADTLRECWRTRRMPQSLADHRLAMWFYGNGFRNRMAFEIGARAMGADVSFVPGELGVHEPIEDIGHYLANWFSLLVIRAKRHAELLRVADQVSLPVINARTEHNHPCEIIGDLQYIRRERGSIEGLNVVFVGEVTNLCQSWFEAAARLPIRVTQVAPPGYELSASEVSRLNAQAEGQIRSSHDLRAEVGRSTDVIYTDCWPQTADATDIRRQFLPYQIDGPLLKTMNQAGFFLPCPPVSRGREVSAEAMQSSLCKDYAAKDFLLHAQNAIMEFLAHSG